jgi:uncharacterized protein YbjQ (UPF0145 family)
MSEDQHKPGFHLPWFHKDPEAEARKAEDARQKKVVQDMAVQVRQAEQQRQHDDLIALARGGLPTQARARLAEIGSSDADGILFTSDLTPDEAGLLRREGFRARGLVTGSAMYHVGQAYASAYNDCEVAVLSDAYDQATQLAVTRMWKELKLIGAHGVVGVRLQLVRHEWADKTIEVQVIGTAVEGPGLAPTDPWMCDLSGQEWYALRRGGYEPVGLVWGHAAWFVLTTQQDEWIHQSWSNQEMTHWSHALSHARHIAMRKVIQLSRERHATGVAGVKITRRLDEVRLYGQTEDPVYEREHHNLVVAIIGTAIRVRPGSSPMVPATKLVISLLDGRLTTVGLGATDAAIE